MIKKFIITFTILFFLSPSVYARGTTGSKLKFEFNARSCFPEFWYRAPISARSSKFNKAYTPQVTRAYEKFYKKYPRKVIDNNLKGVYFFGSLNFYGKTFGGTVRRGNIFIQFDPRKGDYWQYTEKALHHEFSSILMKNYHFPKYEWTADNGRSYDSDDRGRDKLSEGPGRERRALLSAGFLTTYGSSDIENDLNVYADYFFTKRSRLKRHAKKYPAIAKKAKIFKKFYCGIDSNFSFCDK